MAKDQKGNQGLIWGEGYINPPIGPPKRDLEYQFSGLEPPEFHCSVCDGLGVLFNDDGSWSFQKCPAHSCK